MNRVEMEAAVKEIMKSCKPDCPEWANCQRALMDEELFLTLGPEEDICQAVEVYYQEQRWLAEEEGKHGT